MNRRSSRCSSCRTAVPAATPPFRIFTPPFERRTTVQTTVRAAAAPFQPPLFELPPHRHSSCRTTVQVAALPFEPLPAPCELPHRRCCRWTSVVAAAAYTSFDLLLQPASWVHELPTSLPVIVAHSQRQRSHHATLARVHGARPCRAIRCMPYCYLLPQSRRTLPPAHCRTVHWCVELRCPAKVQLVPGPV